MKRSIAIVFVTLATYVIMASAQLPTTWTNPYYFFSNINTPPIVTPQQISADGTAINQKLFPNYDDHSTQNTLGSHVVLLTSCLRDLKHTKDDLAKTHTTVENVKHELEGAKANLANTHIAVESVKKELANVIATVENMKKDANTNVASTIGRMPKSCDDLQKIGHRKSGLYSVMGEKTVDNVYCDFTKGINDTGFQKAIGHVDVKTSPVHFHAQRSSSYSTLNTVLPFDLLKLNLGNAMATSGIFVAPKSGKYLFIYSGISEGNTNARVELQVKTATVDWSRMGQAYGANGHQTFSLQSTLDLAKGDQIKLMFLEGASVNASANVKATPVYFYAQRTSNFRTIGGVLPFELLTLNVGNAMSTNGIFVAPTPGKYFFTSSGVSENTRNRVDLQLKTATTDWTRITQALGTGDFQTYSLHSTLQLAKGDQIRIILLEGTSHDHTGHYTNFVGQLLEEDITQ